MDLSVVIPVYQAAPFLEERLRCLHAHLSERTTTFEIIAVDDGSKDASGDILRRLSLDSLVPVLDGPHLGKFGALARGVARSRGNVIVMTDADLPFELSNLDQAESTIKGGAAIAIGDRNLSSSRYGARLGFVRRIATHAFTFLVSRLVTKGLADTQCGLKAFRGDLGRRLFAALHEKGFAGDVEILYIARLHGIAVERFPVQLVNQGESTVRPMKHGLAMLAALFRIAKRRSYYRSLMSTADGVAIPPDRDDTR